MNVGHTDKILINSVLSNY